MNKRKYIKVLLKTIDILNATGRKWMFISGSVLSFARHKFIDGDIDIAVLDEFNRKDNVKDFIKNGYEYIHGFGCEEIGRQDTLELDGIRVDLHRMYYCDGLSWHFAYVGAVEKDSLCEAVAYQFNIAGIQPLNKFGRVLFFPSNTRSYLTQHYGKDYMIPVDKWHYANDPPNARYTKMYCKKLLKGDL